MLRSIALSLVAYSFLASFSLAAQDDPAAVAAVTTLGCQTQKNADGQIVMVSFVDKEVNDSVLDQLAKLPALEKLVFRGAQLNGSNVEKLAKLTQLKDLTLEDTQVDDAGFEKLKALSALKVLNLRRSTQLSDAAL